MAVLHWKQGLLYDKNILAALPNKDAVTVHYPGTFSILYYFVFYEKQKGKVIPVTLGIPFVGKGLELDSKTLHDFTAGNHVTQQQKE